MNSCRLPPSAGNASAGIPSHSLRPELALYSLWNMGFDTEEISLSTGIPEPLVHKRITMERDRQNNTKTYFERRG